MHRGKAVQKALKLRSSQQLLDEEEDPDFQRLQQSPQRNIRAKSPVPTPRHNFVSQFDYDLPIESTEQPRGTRTTHSRPQPSSRQREAPLLRTRPHYEDLDEDPIFMESNQRVRGPRRTTQRLPLYADDMYDNPRPPPREDLQEKLDQLLRIRYTEPEALCKRLEEAADRQSKDSDALIQRMQLALDEKDKELEYKEKENFELKHRYEQLLNTEKEEYTSEIAMLKATVEQLKAQQQRSLESRPMQNGAMKDIIETYEDMSGMIVTDVKRTDEGYVYNCVQNGSHGSMHFRLLRCDDGGSREYFYEPVLDLARDKAIIEHLPDKMSRGTGFSQDRAPIFHCKLAYALLQKKER